MKLSRLLEIVTILLNKKTVTAAELAQRFGVSTRTIYRDVDALSASGVPVFCTQGMGGGISILEEYTVSRATLTSSERESVLFALQTLKSTKYPEIDAVLNKLGGLFQNNAAEWVSIDFSAWGSNPNAYHKLTDVKTAILQSNIIEFDYLSAMNEKTRRKVEPLRLVFKSQAWYLWGYCLLKQDYRTFRISRMKNVQMTGESFDRARVRQTEKRLPAPGKEKPLTRLVLEFTQEARFRLYDDFDDDHLIDNGNGTYTLEITFPEDEWVYSYILSFGTYVRVIEPEHIRQIIRERARKIYEYYE